MVKTVNWRDLLEPQTKIRDPLYGYIWVTDDELQIIDTPIFQRLRRVNQLALTKYVYPTAEHSRFVHSLGAMHCATQIFTGILNNTHSYHGIRAIDSANMLRRLRYAALLHDIGHIAFSHAAEKLILNPLQHEHLGQFIIANYSPISSILGEHIKPVISILADSVTQDNRLLHQIISGHLDADRADYLMRDSHACGVKYGEYDFERYMQAFGAINESNELKLFVHERDIFVIESFLVARHHYNMQVPYHRTRMGYDIILGRFLKEFLPKCDDAKLGLTVEEGAYTKVDLQKFEFFDDYSVFNHIKHEARTGNLWANMLLRQGHLCPVYDTTDSVDRGGKVFKKIIRRLKAKNFAEDDDFFQCRKEITASKLISTDEKENSLADTSRETIYVRTKSGKLVDIVKHSNIVRALRPVTIYRIYTSQKRKSEAEAVIADVCRKTQVDRRG